MTKDDGIFLGVALTLWAGTEGSVTEKRNRRESEGYA